MPFTVADVFNAIVGYYVLVLAGSAAIGATRALRGDPQATAAASIDPAAGSTAAAVPASTAGGGGTPVLSGRAARITGLGYSRGLRAFHRFGWATGVGIALGWLAGVDMYRWATPRAAALAARVRDRRARSADPETPEIDDIDDEGDIDDDGEPAPAVTIPAAPTARDQAPPAPAPPAAPPATALGPSEHTPDDGDGLTPPQWLTDHARRPQPAAATGGNRPALADRPNADAIATPDGPGAIRRGHLVLVPQPQEYPPIMPATDITDLESLIHFTGETATVAGMEAEDASAASASMIAGAEFAAETATRVAGETASLEAAVAAMAMLRVDADSVAAYHALLEAGQVYRDTTATFSAQCHDAAATAGQMSAAATHYHETAAAALAVLNAHQMPHAEAASATGHGGAEGQFYGVANTGQPALADSGAPALPAG